MKNAYPDKPIIAYIRTTVTMPEIVSYMKKRTSIDAEVLRAVYFMFRNESGNGKSGVNHNYIGAQADGNPWPPELDYLIKGVVAKKENRTGMIRLFLAFDRWESSIEFLINRVQSRGLYYDGYERLITKKKVSEQISMEQAYAHDLIAHPERIDEETTEEMSETQLKMVNIALAYIRSWVKGDAHYMPHPNEIKGIISMYKQAVKCFPDNGLLKK